MNGRANYSRVRTFEQNKRSNLYFVVAGLFFLYRNLRLWFRGTLWIFVIHFTLTLKTIQNAVTYGLNCFTIYRMELLSWIWNLVPYDVLVIYVMLSVRCIAGEIFIEMDYDYGNSDFPGMYSADNNKKNDSDCKFHLSCSCTCLTGTQVYALYLLPYCSSTLKCNQLMNDTIKLVIWTLREEGERKKFVQLCKTFLFLLLLPLITMFCKTF